MIEYSFDNSLVNSRNGKPLHHQAASETKSPQRISTFSESQSLQNFIKKKVLDYDDKDNIYKRILVQGRYGKLIDGIEDNRRLSDKMRSGSSNERIPKEARYSIYKNITMRTDSDAGESRVAKMRKGLNLRIKKQTDITQVKEEGPPKKKSIAENKEGRLSSKTTSMLPKFIKLPASLATAKYPKIYDKFVKRAAKHSSTREYNNTTFSSLNYIKKKKAKEQLHTSSNKDISYSNLNPNSISVEKSIAEISKTMAKRNLSSNVLSTPVSKSSNNLKGSKSKGSLFNDENSEMWHNQIKIKRPSGDFRVDARMNFYASQNRKISDLEDSKDKFDNIAAIKTSYRQLKKDNAQKASTMKKNAQKTNLQALTSPNEKGRTSLKQQTPTEREEYNGDIGALLDDSCSNKTSGKSIENAENFIGRMSTKSKMSFK